MAKKSKKPLDILGRKKDKLDWHKFNFLENLLVFRLLAEKSVPQESGVKFRVTPKDGGTAMCLLFKIDSQNDPLIKNDEIKPDYMVMYVRKDLCLCTIIEMKGKVRKNLEHGIEQIKALREKLRNELRESVKSNFKIKFQAILLTQFNSDIPRKKIAEEKKKGLTILPLQYSDRAQLFSYVSKLNEITEKYIHEQISPSDDQMLVEKLFVNFALQERIQDKFCSANKDKTGNKEGCYINYAFPDCEDYAALAMDTKEMKIGVTEDKGKLFPKIVKDLENLGLKESHHFKVVKIEE